uniref:Uncharacterized protein n=1 Tax=Panagrolaimus superbus TaxID=310955 RepID=A0A914Z6X6_9BILA
MLPVLEELAGPGALILSNAMIKDGRISCSDIVRQAKDDSSKTDVEFDTKDTSYEFNPTSSQFLYDVDLLKVNLNQFQKVLQYQSNYLNRHLKEKEEIIAIKSVKNKVRKMINYAKQNITDDSELADTIEDVGNDFDYEKRMRLRRNRQFREYIKKVEMMLNETIWIWHRNCEMEQRK